MSNVYILSPDQWEQRYSDQNVQLFVRKRKVSNSKGLKKYLEEHPSKYALHKDCDQCRSSDYPSAFPFEEMLDDESMKSFEEYRRITPQEYIEKMEALGYIRHQITPQEYLEKYGKKD